MMAKLDQEHIQLIVEKLLAAEKSRQPIAPLTQDYPDLSIEDAYRIQLSVIEKKKANGTIIVGKKAGITSKAIQQMFDVNEPDYGHLLDNMLVHEGEEISCAALLQPKVEPEIAFILGEDLQGPGVSAADVLAATKCVLPVLEIIDSRIADWKIKLPDTIADNASCGKVVVGGKIRKVDGLDLRLVGVVFEKNGEVMATGAGAAALGNPANAVAWLANKLATLDQKIKANELILPGSLTPAFAVAPGDHVCASFDHLGSVSIRFS
jgi:2-keto-4-pentenoate hydratase